MKNFTGGTVGKVFHVLTLKGNELNWITIEKDSHDIKDDVIEEKWGKRFSVQPTQK